MRENKLGWVPKVKFKELVKLMYEEDYNLIKGVKNE
jgi:GDP-D-mannose dehydratase